MADKSKTSLLLDLARDTSQHRVVISDFEGKVSSPQNLSSTHTRPFYDVPNNAYPGSPQACHTYQLHQHSSRAFMSPSTANTTKKSIYAGGTGYSAYMKDGYAKSRDMKTTHTSLSMNEKVP